MLIFDQVRGEHSTGVAFINRQSASPKVAKQVGGPFELFETKQFEKGIAGLNRALIGHNRWATIGKVSRENAHPFTRGAVTGVHNGSLRSYSDLEGYATFDVDSEILYNHIDQHGLRNALENCSGAMALVWWNEETRTLNIYRNHERPLCIAMTKDKQVAFLASEAWMIQAACGRQKTPVEITEVTEVPAHALFTYELPDNFIGALPKPTATHIEPKVESPRFQQPWYAGCYQPNQQQQSANTQSNNTNNGVHVLPQNVECTYYEVITVYGYEWAVFYENEGNKEFILPLASAKSLGLTIGTTIKSNCSGYLYDRQNGKCDQYYKLKTEDVQVVTQAFSVTSGDEMEDEDGTLFLGYTGRQMARQAWYKQYGVCSNCTGDIEHTDLFKFSKAGDILCEECATSPEINL